MVFHHYFLAEGLTKTSASNAGLILGMGPILTVILTMIFFRKKTHVNQASWLYLRCTRCEFYRYGRKRRTSFY
ncbi:EamA family transporter [Peribacillus frigoritolerans]|nr:EamA family transporter [Peribacillus frigoritolerans]